MYIFCINMYIYICFFPYYDLRHIFYVTYDFEKMRNTMRQLTQCFGGGCPNPINSGTIIITFLKKGSFINLRYALLLQCLGRTLKNGRFGRTPPWNG